MKHGLNFVFFKYFSENSKQNPNSNPNQNALSEMKRILKGNGAPEEFISGKPCESCCCKC